MKKYRLLSIMLVFLLCFSLVSVVGFADDTLESGTDEQAILSILTEEDLLNFASSVSDGTDYSGKTVSLENDIALTEDWTPIGDYYNCFKGVFEGNGHTVSNLKITVTAYEDYTGFFACICGAEIRDLNLSGNISCTVKVHDVGSLAGYAREGSVISNCRSSVKIDAQKGSYVGGIVGSVDYGGRIEYCRNSGEILSGTYVRPGNAGGGIAGQAQGGYNDDGSYDEENSVAFNRCLNLGSVSGNGGILGSGERIIFTECGNTGDVSGDGTGLGVGGIAGYLSGNDAEFNNTITSCYNTGTITAVSGTGSRRTDDEPYVAGILGRLASQNTKAVYFGLVEIKNCYSTGTLVKTGKYTSMETRCGDIVMLRNMNATFESGNIENITVADMDTSFVSDCYGSEDTITAELMNTNAPDTWVERDGAVRLKWEQSDEELVYEADFALTPSDSSCTVYADKELTQVIEPEDGVYKLKNGTYFYRVSCDGYVPVTGSFTVDGMSVKKEVALTRADVIRIEVVSGDNTEIDTAGITVTAGSAAESSKNAVFSEQEGNVYTFLAYPDTDYLVSVSAPGYSSFTDQIRSQNGKQITVTLNESSRPEEETDSFVYGSLNEGKTDTITDGGTYYIGDDARGILTIDTTEEVTLVGKGISESAAYTDLFIDCIQSGSHLVLKDVYLNEEQGSANAVDFSGDGNYLGISGICLIDMNTGASGYAAIHVGEDTALTVSSEDNGRLYLYKYEQGAGIGGNGGASGGEGQTAETNGKISLEGLTLFAKGSKQGALIGAGAQAGEQTPGLININDCDLNLVCMARGGAIGGSAGSTGASAGSTVNIKDSRVSVNVDYTGAAIGGGGYDSGNDSDGGTLITSGSTIRTWIDSNATSSWGVTGAGVNGNKAITADIKNTDGEDLYLCELDTSQLEGDYFEVSCDGETAYKGSCIENNYVNYNTKMNGEKNIYTTLANWTEYKDQNLYLYFTGEDHLLDVNGQRYRAAWDEETKTFTLSEAAYDGLYGDVNFNDKVNIVDAQIVYDMAGGAYQDNENYETMLLAADVNGDNCVTALDARAIQVFVHTGKFE